MLAIKDRWHIVEASLPGLADAARLSLKDCQDAIEVLSSPDPYSRTTEFEGRRIEKCEGGWLILNGEKYRNKMSLDERREYQRIKQREYRERRQNVKSCQQNSQQLTHTDTDTDTDTDTNTNKDKNNIGQTEFDRFWETYPKKVKKKNTLVIWKRKHLNEKVDEIVTDIQLRLIHDKRWLGGFIPDPTTYLNGERWNDECALPLGG